MPPVNTQTQASEQQYVQNLLAEQAALMQRGETQLLGQIMRIQTDRGWMEFYHEGPILGARRDRFDLLLLTEWKGLPELRKPSQTPCGHCTATCEQCAGEGKSVCELCGGAGKRYRRAVCECAAGKPCDPKCKTCRGVGMFEEPYTCECCDGSKKMTCPRCRGLKMESTGIYPPEMRGKPNALPCPQCRGHRIVIELEPQKMEKFLHGRLAGYDVYGPIRSIAYKAMGGAARLDIVAIEPDLAGNLMVLLLEPLQGGLKRGYFLGGLAKLATLRP